MKNTLYVFNISKKLENDVFIQKHRTDSESVSFPVSTVQFLLAKAQILKAPAYPHKVHMRNVF